MQFRFSKNISLRDAAIWMFFCLGVSRMIGTYFGGPWVNLVARTIALSPNPAPYLTVRTFENQVDKGIWVWCRKADGPGVPIQWTAELRSRLDIPQRLLAQYTGAFANLDSRSRPELGRYLVKRMLCTDTRLAAAFQCGTDTLNFQVVYSSGTLERSRANLKLELSCKDQL